MILAAAPNEKSRDVVLDVLLEAFGASATPWVPVPFVDDWVLARVLRRITGKVLARHGLTSPPELPAVITKAYVDAEGSSIAKTAVVGAARFAIRKLAVVLDVKKTYDLFGQSIAYALALDIAAERGWLHEASAERVGAAVYRTLKVVGSGAIDSLGRAAREAFSRGGKNAVVDALAGEVAHMRSCLETTLKVELRVPDPE